MKAKNENLRTLGTVSAGLINELLKRGKIFFTLDDAANLYGNDKHELGKFLSGLIKRNLVVRIKSGIYMILQTGQENIQLSNWAVIANQLAQHKYYISYYSAMRLHGMTTHSIFDVYITMIKRQRDKTINNINYHFIYSKAKNFWGGSDYWVSKQEKIQVSDIERTLLDGLERPELCGGIKEVIRGIWIKSKDVDWKKMGEYAARFHSKSAVKRLGYILEVLSLEIEFVNSLAKSIASAKDYIFLDPDGDKQGRHQSRWHIRLNMNIDELKASIWG